MDGWVGGHARAIFQNMTFIVTMKVTFIVEGGGVEPALFCRNAIFIVEGWWLRHVQKL